MALRIEITKNFRGLYDVREGDLSGATEHSNLDEAGVIEEIKYLLRRLDDRTEKTRKENCERHYQIF